MRRHHDQIDVQLISGRDDRVRRISDSHNRAAGNLRRNMSAGYFFQVALCRVSEPFIRRRWISEPGHRNCYNVEWM